MQKNDLQPPKFMFLIGLIFIVTMLTGLIFFCTSCCTLSLSNTDETGAQDKVTDTVKPSTETHVDAKVPVSVTGGK